MNAVNRSCPICTQNGKQSTLELRQINLTEAVYICADRSCVYPIGFQWDYIKNNILTDSDDSSDENSKPTTKPELNDTKITLTNGLSKSAKKRNSLNISSVIVKNADIPQANINKQDNAKKNNSESFTRATTECVRKNNSRIMKSKTQNSQNTIPESVIQNAKALSKYFSNQAEKPKNNFKSVFDIIEQPIKKQSNIENSTNEINTCVVDEINNYIKIEEKKANNDLPETLDDFFKTEENCDENNLDLAEMDELLSFL